MFTYILPQIKKKLPSGANDNDKKFSKELKLEHFPKSVKHFLDKKCDKQKNLVPHSLTIEKQNALNETFEKKNTNSHVCNGKA